MGKKCAIIKQGHKARLADVISCEHKCYNVYREGKLIFCSDCGHLQLGAHPKSEDITQ